MNHSDNSNRSGNVGVEDDLDVESLFAGVDFTVDVDDDRNNVSDNNEGFEKTNDKFLSELVEIQCETLQTQTYHEIEKKLVSIAEEGKVKKLIVREGSGKCPDKGCTVHVHYISFIEHDEVPFDSSYTRGFRPEQFKIGVGDVYEGFETAVKSMKPQELSFFLIHPDLAFKELGVPPRIPRNAHICIEIELINITNMEEEGGDFSDFPYVDKRCFKEVYRKAKVLLLQGNINFKEDDFRAAITNYKKAEATLLSCRIQNDEEESKWKKMLLKISLNLCACFNHNSIEKPKLVCVITRELLDTFPDIATKHAKIYFHLGIAKYKLNDLEGAKKNFNKALQLKDDDEEIIDYIRQVERRQAKEQNLDELDTQLNFMKFQ